MLRFMASLLLTVLLTNSSTESGREHYLCSTTRCLYTGVTPGEGQDGTHVNEARASSACGSHNVMAMAR